jgi:transcriptional regulator with XRE-family HTH domain
VANGRSPVRSPTVRRRRLANELRRLREGAGLIIDQVAETLECSSSKISRIETASVNPTPRDVRDMLQLYGASGDQLEELRQLAREARQREGLYFEYRDIPNVTYADLEAVAESIEMYQDLIVPGFLQTADYARAVLRAIRVDLRSVPEEIERRVNLRLERQVLLAERLAQQDPPQIWVVLDEAALRRPIGGREVARAQLERLSEFAERSKITLQVLPFAAGAHAGLDGAFTIVGFPDPVHPDVVYIENSTRDLYLEASDAIRRYVQLFDHLRAAALDPSESLAFLTHATKEL